MTPELTSTLSRMPETHLLDMVSNGAIWQSEMRLEAARLLLNRMDNRGCPTELSHKVALKAASHPEFASILESVRKARTLA